MGSSDSFEGQGGGVGAGVSGGVVVRGMEVVEGVEGDGEKMKEIEGGKEEDGDGDRKSDEKGENIEKVSGGIIEHNNSNKEGNSERSSGKEMIKIAKKKTSNNMWHRVILHTNVHMRQK